MIFSASDKIILQGATGREGARMLLGMLGSGAAVVAGVTPGKGGQEIHGVPVFDSVRAAQAQFPDVRISCIAVPPHAVRDAVIEALSAGIKLVHLFTDHVPVQDAVKIRTATRRAGALVLGPGSVGAICGNARIGYLGGDNPFATPRHGDIALISSSGGMLNEILHACDAEGKPIASAWSVGGARVPATQILELIELLDESTIGIFVEPGNSLLKHPPQTKKKIVLLVAGLSLANLPRGTSYGHAGSVLDDEPPSLDFLRESGMVCTTTVADFIAQL